MIASLDSGECLQALARLDYPRGQFEVVVVDDGGNTPPKDMVALFRSELDVTVVTQPHAGPATARNTGAANARGRFLVFTDDDCRPAPSWLHALEARFAETPACLVGGRVINALSDNRYATASQTLIDYLYSYYNADFDAATFFASNNCDRWLRSRRRMRYVPGAVVSHAHALGFRTFWRQHFRYGRGAARFHSVRASYTQTGIRVEPPRFYLNLLRYPFSRGPARHALHQALLMGVTQVANATGFACERIARSRRGLAGQQPSPVCRDD